MTAQAHDTVRWKSEDYLLVGVQGHGLFDPAKQGLEVRPTTTANWRGWVALYTIVGDHLMLAELNDVGLSPEQAEAPPTIDGVTATLVRHSFAYRALGLPIAFTGRLLIARGFIRSLYRHMGFHPAWKFEESWEIELSEGRVLSARELSDEMRSVRERIEAGEVEDPDSPDRPGWIQRTFGLDFWRSKGDG